MRLFETTGVGTCLVTDWKSNLGELFEPDREVVTYRSAEECVDKVKWLLEHPAEREDIARSGQSRTLKDHSFAQRAVQLDQIIRRELSRQ
jgi:spore maturation protein CgeB